MNLRIPFTLLLSSALALASMFGATAFADSPAPTRGLREHRIRFADHADGGVEGDGGHGHHLRVPLTDEQKAARKSHMAELRAKWGTMLKQPAIREEMHQHQSRMARLRRIEKLAKANKKDAVVKRADAAIDNEKKRHDSKMAQLKAHMPPTAGTANTAAAATVTPVTPVTPVTTAAGAK